MTHTINYKHGIIKQICEYKGNVIGCGAQFGFVPKRRFTNKLQYSNSKGETVVINHGILALLSLDYMANDAIFF